MAFNPFSVFRRNQKVLMVGVLIVCMIMFVFSFGPGDLFSRDWFGGGQGDPVAEVDGDDLHANELYDLASRRRIANAFLDRMFLEAEVESILTVARERAVLESIPSMRMAIVGIPGQGQFRGIPGALTHFNFLFQLLPAITSQSKPEEVQRARATIVNLLLRFGALAQKDALRKSLDDLRDGKSQVTLQPAQTRAVSALERALQYQLYRSDFERFRQSFFLGGTESAEGLIDFMLWKKRADELGIDLPEETLIQLVNSVARQQMIVEDSLEDSGYVSGFLAMVGGQQEYREVSDLKVFRAALEDEFRVLLAKEVILGIPPPSVAAPALENIYASPAKPTLLEFFDFYKKHRTSVDVEVMTLPIDDSVGDVEGKPTQKELQDLFEKYKEIEPNPELDHPGFKEPRRVRTQYVELPAEDAPLYQSKALLKSTLVDFLAIQTPNIGGSVLGNATTALIPLLMREQELATAYETFEKTQTWIDPENGLVATNESGYHDQILLGEDSKGAVSLGMKLSVPMPFSFGAEPNLSSLVYFGSVLAAETRVRKQVSARQRFVGNVTRTLLARPVALTFSGVGDIISIAAANSDFPGENDVPAILAKIPELEPTSFDKMRSQLLEESQSIVTSRRAFRDKDIEELQKEIKGLAKHIQEGNDQKELDKVLERFHIDAEPTSMKELRDKFALEDDPDLATLADEFGESQKVTGVQSLLFDNAGVYFPFRHNGTNGKQYLLWHVEEQKSFIPKTMKSVEAKVEKAWYRLRARRIALSKAREMAKKLENERAERAKIKTAVTAEMLALSKFTSHTSSLATGNVLGWLANLQVIGDDKSSKTYSTGLRPIIDEIVVDRRKFDGEKFMLRNVARLVPVGTPSSFAPSSYEGYSPPEASIRYPELDPESGMVERLLQLKKVGDAVVFWDKPRANYYVAVCTRRDEPTVDATFIDAYKNASLPASLWTAHFMPDLRAKYRDAIITQMRIEAGVASEDGKLKLDEEFQKNFNSRNEAR